jgi:U3 small nucleolar RNA-associated protein 4
MSLQFTPAAPASMISNSLRNPLGKAKGMSRVVFDEAYLRKMSYIGGGGNTGRVAFSAQGRLVVGRKDRGVGIWRVLEDEQGWEKVLEMELRVSQRRSSVILPFKLTGS